MQNTTVRYEMNSTTVMSLTLNNLQSINSNMGLNLTSSDVHVRGIYTGILIAINVISVLKNSLTTP